MSLDLEKLVAFERAWDSRLGGEPTRELRYVLGVCCARITNYDIKPEDVLEYMRVVMNAVDNGESPSPLKAV